MCTKGRDLFAPTSDESALRGIPRSRGTIAAPGPDGDRVSTITRPSRAGDRTDSINVARVQPGTSKGITDLLLLLFVRLQAADPAKKETAYAPTADFTSRQHTRPEDRWYDERSDRFPRQRLNRIGTLVNRSESRSLSELTRQIAPRARNGHAPPPTESRKSRSVCQSSRCPGPVRFPVLSRIKPQAPQPKNHLPRLFPLRATGRINHLPRQFSVRRVLLTEFANGKRRR